MVILDRGQIVAQGELEQLITDMVGIEVFEVSELDRLAAMFSQCDAPMERVAASSIFTSRTTVPAWIICSATGVTGCAG